MAECPREEPWSCGSKGTRIVENSEPSPDLAVPYDLQRCRRDSGDIKTTTDKSQPPKVRGEGGVGLCFLG